MLIFGYGDCIVLNYYMQMMVILKVNACLQNEGENDGGLLLNMCIMCHMFMLHKS